MNNSTKRTFLKNTKGNLIALEDIQGVFSGRHGSMALDYECNLIDFLSVNDGDTEQHLKANIKKMKDIGNVDQRLTLPDGGFVTTNLIKTVIQSKAGSSVLIIGINDKVLIGFDEVDYNDIDGLHDAIYDTLIAIGQDKKSRVQWSEYATEIEKVKLDKPAVSAKSVSQPVTATAAK